MYYGYINDGETYAVSHLTAAKLAVNTVTSASPASTSAVINAPAGSLIFVLVPASSSLVATKDDGLGNHVQFDTDNGAANTGANGTSITINNIQYRVYGEFNLANVETSIYISEE